MSGIRRAEQETHKHGGRKNRGIQRFQSRIPRAIGGLSEAGTVCECKTTIASNQMQTMVNFEEKDGV